MRTGTAIAVAALHSLPAAIVVLVVFVVYQQLENHVLQPVIMSRTVQLSALTVLVSILIGVELFGFLGALLAAFGGQGSPARRTGLVEPLTERELVVLRLLAAGRSNAEMASELFVEQSTVKTHLIHLYSKLGVHSRTQAVARARALGLLD